MPTCKSTITSVNFFKPDKGHNRDFPCLQLELNEPFQLYNLSNIKECMVINTVELSLKWMGCSLWNGDNKGIGMHKSRGNEKETPWDWWEVGKKGKNWSIPDTIVKMTGTITINGITNRFLGEARANKENLGRTRDRQILLLVIYSKAGEGDGAVWAF